MSVCDHGLYKGSDPPPPSPSPLSAILLVTGHELRQLKDINAAPPPPYS